MSDKAWKAHERDVAKFFGTSRALHGIDRVDGEVNTDVFVSCYEWLGPNDPLADVALVVECKYSKQNSSSNTWMLKKINEISKEPGVKAAGSIPVLVTKDNWMWVQLKDFETLLRSSLAYGPSNLLEDFLRYEVRHINKKMSKFFYSALLQAEDAQVPDLAENFEIRVNTVCVGSNARLPKCIGLDSSSVVEI